MECDQELKNRRVIKERKLCPETGKTSYSSKDRARKAMKGLSHRLRAYRCNDCNFWHLTKDT